MILALKFKWSFVLKKKLFHSQHLFSFKNKIWRYKEIEKRTKIKVYKINFDNLYWEAY